MEKIAIYLGYDPFRHLNIFIYTDLKRVRGELNWIWIFLRFSCGSELQSLLLKSRALGGKTGYNLSLNKGSSDFKHLTIPSK